MSSSRDLLSSRFGGRQAAFTVIELLVSLAIVAGLMGVIGSLLVAQQKACAAQADQTLLAMQISVAGGRLEKQLRLAGAGGCPFATETPILEASPSQVVFLERSATGSTPGLVEWEIVGGSLMRRWGACPTGRPLTYSHSLYNDNKTMLEGVIAGSRFRYLVRGTLSDGPVAYSDLPLVEAVVLDLRAVPAGGQGAVEATVSARVAR